MGVDHERMRVDCGQTCLRQHCTLECATLLLSGRKLPLLFIFVFTSIYYFYLISVHPAISGRGFGTKAVTVEIPLDMTSPDVTVGAGDDVGGDIDGGDAIKVIEEQLPPGWLHSIKTTVQEKKDSAAPW